MRPVPPSCGHVFAIPPIRVTMTTCQGIAPLVFAHEYLAEPNRRGLFMAIEFPRPRAAQMPPAPSN